jgi:hypothetical protein
MSLKLYLTAGTAVVAAAGAAAYFVHAGRTPEAQAAAHWTTFERYCVDCHNDAERTGGLSLEGLEPHDVTAKAATFEEVVRKLKLGVMPPREEAQPDPAVRVELVASIESMLDAAVAKSPSAPANPVHRLNRAEYGNAIRDLLGVELDVAGLLPSDGGDHGFDNVAAALTTSPMLLERYLTVALRVASLAVGDTTLEPTEHAYRIPVETTQDKHLAGLPLGTRGGVLVTHVFPADASYVLAGRLLRTVAEGYYGVEGHDRPHEFVITLDGEQVFSALVGGPEDHAESSKNILDSRVTVDAKMTSPPIPITAGPHELGFTWVEKPAAEQSVWQPPLRATLEAHNPSGLPRLETAIIQGPYDATGVSPTPSRERIFVCEPKSTAEEPACAEQIFTSLARRAFRRPVGADDVTAPLEFYTAARASGADFDTGIREGLARLLVSPSFLFRAEQDRADVPAGGIGRISDIELASRLSFFLWSSIPDEELLGLAEQDRLHEAPVLRAQVERMLADERANALVENFTGQWLQLRNLELRVKPDLLLFPDFDDNLRKAFRTETEMLFANVLRTNASALELLSASYTFVNERLARHYGIPGVYGARFRRIEHTDPNRYGLLGHGSLLSLTSAASRTSPIIRGKYVLATLLNDPPPLPPDVVPALEDSAPKDRPSTVREQLELHRADPVCASCHRNIDPIGFALENFDTVGVWRDETLEGLPIDSAGVLADGTPVNGPAELREAMIARPEVFAGNVAEKLMIYALGRGLTPADMPHVRAILRQTEPQGYRLSDIVLGIVDSVPFRMRTRRTEPGTLELTASEGR